MLTINIPTDDTRALIRTYLDIFNIINPVSTSVLTDKETKLLVEFLLLPEKYSYQRFSRYAKPIVLKNLKEHYDWNLTALNLNSKIYELINKGYIWRDADGVLYLKKYLLDVVSKVLKGEKDILIKFHDKEESR